MIYDILPVNNYLGNNSATLFEFDFLIDDSSQLAVYLFDEDGSKHKLIQDIDYSVENIQNQHGGHIIFPISGSKYNILNDKQKISLELDIPTSQETQYNNSSLLNLSAIEYSFDYLTRLVQIIKRKLSLCVKVEECSENTPQDLLNSINNSAIETKNNALNSAKILSEIKNETNKILNHSYFTNSLLEIPQRIKLDLTDGVLTIKSGSVVIVPYGVEDLTTQYPKGATFLNDNYKVYDTQFVDGNFFVWVEIQEDRSCGTTQSTINNRTVWFNPQGGVNTGDGDFLFSGTTTPTGDYAVWYDTTRNIITRTMDGGVTWTDYQSFPVVVGAFTKNYGFNSVQAFNGMGYIGSTVWVDKGVKILIPNGRNEDGTLNNIEYTSTKIITSSSTATQDYVIRLGALGSLSQRQLRYFLTVKSLEDLYKLDVNTSYYVHVTDENFTYFTSNGEWVVASDVPIATATLTQGVVSNFQPKQPFRALDYNNKSEISGWAMPSNKYIDLTLGASGTSYTAPANGWVFARTKAGSNKSFLQINNSTTALQSFSNMYTVGARASGILPVQKGQVFSFGYETGDTVEFFRFIYAQGEV